MLLFCHQPKSLHDPSCFLLKTQIAFKLLKKSLIGRTREEYGRQRVGCHEKSSAASQPVHACFAGRSPSHPEERSARKSQTRGTGVALMK